MKKGDTEPALGAILEDDKGNARDLTNVDEVRFYMEDAGSNDVAVDDTATIVTASDGEVVYNWSSGDTDTVGEYDAEFEVHYSDGDVETFPNYRSISVVVTRDIN